MVYNGLKHENKVKFAEIITIIKQSSENAFISVNHGSVSISWKIGA